MSRGNWNVICDFCGRKRKASECRMTWDNFFVCADTCWQPRHPQDFVRGVADDQTVPVVRSDVVQSMGTTTLSSAASKNAVTVTLASVSGLTDRDALGIVLDTGECHWTFSDGIPAAGGVVTLGSYLPGNASLGNIVYLPSINNEKFVTATSITPADL